MRARPPARDGTPSSHVQLEAGSWSTVLQALCARFPRIPAVTWQARLAEGRVLDGCGRPVLAGTVCHGGMSLYYYREVQAEPRVPFEESVLHVDAHLVVADKPHFLPVTPAGGYVRETLLARLIRRLGNPALVPLHRIDRATAGLVLFSADPASRDQYQALFRQRCISKAYEAWAPALPELGFPHVRASRLVTGDPFFRMCEAPGTPNSETRVEVMERADRFWRYRLEPVTGRKHQLRVHMAALGAPILHDRFYPQLANESADDHERPLQLLARSLRFVDPLTGADREFVSRLSLSSEPGHSVEAANGAS
ncbi:MAG: pseudouridine synthase [Pseudomonadota bacterium]|nr:pseudouridine synthase [Pseudomonadota bacterium]